MKVAVVGCTGYIATHLIEYFNLYCEEINLVRIGRTKEDDFYLDLNEPQKFDFSLLRNIDFIVFTAAISSPDKCKNEFEECWKINVSNTSYFIESAIEMGCKVIFFSSDTVYGMESDKIFTEHSDTNAATTYGKMKKSVEDMFNIEDNFKAIRLSYVVSSNDKFVSYCMKCIERQEVAEIFHPFYRNCITINDVIDIVMWLMNNWDGFQQPVVNACGTELVSRIRIADEINRYMNDKLRYKIVCPEESFFEDRAKITQMKSEFLYKNKIIENESFSEKFKKEMEKIKL